MNPIEYLKQHKCCGKPLKIVKDAQNMDMNVLQRDFGVCLTCRRVITILDEQIDEEELEILQENYPELEEVN